MKGKEVLMKRYVLLFMSLVLVFTSGTGYSRETKVNIKKWKSRDKPVLQQVTFKGFWEAMKNLDLEYPERNNLDQSHRDFARGLKSATDGAIEKAEEIFKKVILSTNDPDLENHAKELFVLFVGYRMGYNPEILFQTDTPGNIRDVNIIPFDMEKKETYKFPDKEIVVQAIASGSGVPMVEVTLNNEREILWIDTGTSNSLVASDIAEECRISPVGSKTFKAQTITSRKIETRLSCIKQLNIDNFEILNHPAGITDADNMRYYHSIKMDGILGWNAIRHMLITIEIKNRRLTIRRPPANPSDQPNLFWFGFPVVKVKSKDGVPLYFGLDTGAEFSTITDNIFKKMDFKKVFKDSRIIWGAGGEEKIECKVVPKLEIILDGALLEFKDIYTLPKHHAQFIELDGVLGNDILDETRLIIDGTNGIVAIEEL